MSPHPLSAKLLQENRLKTIMYKMKIILLTKMFIDVVKETMIGQLVRGKYLFQEERKRSKYDFYK